MDRDELSRIVLDVVRSHAAPGSAEPRLDAPLGPDGLGIDSIGCLDVVLELERRTGIPLRDESLSAETLATPGNLVEHLVRAGRG